MSVIFDSAAAHNATSFGSGVYRMPEHTPTPLADILAAYHSHSGRIKPGTKPVRHTTKDEAWDLGYRLALSTPGALPPANYSAELRESFAAGTKAAQWKN